MSLSTIDIVVVIAYAIGIFSLAQWVSREAWHPEQRGRWLDGGSYELEVPYANETEIAMDILRQGEQVKVCAPASLVKAVTGRLTSASAQYA